MKRGIIVLLGLLIFLTQGILCFAQTEQNISPIGIDIQSDTMTAFFKPNQESTEFKTAITRIDGTEMETTLSTLEDETEYPVTYMCLVDVSGSMDEKRMQSVRDIIKQLVQQKKENDNFCIQTVGNEITDNGFCADEETLYNQIDAIKVLREDTNLYYAIQNAVEILETDEQAYANKCLIIFSDGAEDQDTGITREEAESAIREVVVPVYTVAMIKQNASEQQLESAKILGSFARISMGGVHYAPVLEEYSYEEVADKIKEEIESTYVVQTRLRPLSGMGEYVLYETEMTDREENVQLCSMEISSGLLQDTMLIRAEETTEVEEPIEEETLESAEAERNQDIKKNPASSYIAGIAAIFVIAGSVAGIVLWNLRKKKQPESEKQPELSQPVLQKQAEKACGTLILNGVGQPEQKAIRFELRDKCLVGRSKGKCDIAIDNGKISSVHCCFLFQEGNLYVRDEGSTNGTLLNGVPVFEKTRVQQDDVLEIGAEKYRIAWIKK